MDSELSQQVVLLMGGAVVKVRRTAHGATVLVTDEDTGEQVIADTAQCQHLREALDSLNDEKIELQGRVKTTDNILKGERYKLHAQRLDLSERLRNASVRLYAAERRVRELEAKIEAMEQAFDYGQPNPFKAKG
jgi:chromosome segregation ATPase